MPVATMLCLETWDLEARPPKNKPRMWSILPELEMAFGTSLYLCPPKVEQLSNQIFTHCLSPFSPLLIME